MADELKVRRAKQGADRLRAFTVFTYAAKSWTRERKVVARLEATTQGFDARYVVTSLPGDARPLYEDVYCVRGQAENLIKLHKAQLASDRTSCRSPVANQVRLVLHTAAYWLLLRLRDAIPDASPLAKAEFATLRLKLLKIAARVVEKAARIRIFFASACPEARSSVSSSAASPPPDRETRGAPCPAEPQPIKPQRRHRPPAPPTPYRRRDHARPQSSEPRPASTP